MGIPEDPGLPATKTSLLAAWGFDDLELVLLLRLELDLEDVEIVVRLLLDFPLLEDLLLLAANA